MMRRSIQQLRHSISIFGKVLISHNTQTHSITGVIGEHLAILMLRAAPRDIDQRSRKVGLHNIIGYAEHIALPNIQCALIDLNLTQMIIQYLGIAELFCTIIPKLKGIDYGIINISRYRAAGLGQIKPGHGH